MKFKPLICACMALTMASANVAFAQGRGDRGDRGDRDRNYSERRGGDRDFRHDNGRRGPPPWANNRYDRPVPQYRHWNRGDRLPPEYRDRQYVVSDWRGHRLRPPPRGYHWVQSGSDYLLVAVATGVILELLRQ
jgi:Ni/Co efflux regulator RcnB